MRTPTFSPRPVRYSTVSSTVSAPKPMITITRSAWGSHAFKKTDRAPFTRRTQPSTARRSLGRRRRSDWRTYGPGRNVGFSAVPRSAGRSESAHAPVLAHFILDIRLLRSSSSISSIFATSCEVRKPSKKWRNGTPHSSVAARAIAAMCEPPEPIRSRTGRTRLGGSHHVGVVAENRERMSGEVRAATCIAKADSSPAILYILGSSGAAPGGGEGRRERTRLERTVDGARCASLLTASRPRPGRLPQRFVLPWPDHWSASSPIGELGVIGKIAITSLNAESDRGRRLVAVDGNPEP